MPELKKTIAAVLPEIISLRRELHRHPELAFKEQRTSQRVAEILAAAGGLSITTGMAKTGVVALLNGGKPGPCLGLRADMDALPLAETTGLPYASRTHGQMHACGHDGHTSCLVGAALVLSRIADELPGQVKFIFQPAEEDGGGGRRMVEEGVLDNPKVSACIALHAWPTRTVGAISLCPGPFMAFIDNATITVIGRGTHAAHPERGIDPILAAAHIVVALQSIVSRGASPLESAVITVGSIHGGTAPNIIPEECRLLVTMRSQQPETRLKLQTLVRQIAANTALAFGASAKVEIEEDYPVLVNDPALSEWIADVGSKVLGADRVSGSEPPCMGGEDFAYYAERVPAVMFCLGVRPAGQESYPPLHSPLFNFNDDALETGILMFCELAVRFLRGGGVLAA